MGAQNLGFSIDFDSRPYNSVMLYRATLWQPPFLFFSQTKLHKTQNQIELTPWQD